MATVATVLNPKKDISANGYPVCLRITQDKKSRYYSFNTLVTQYHRDTLGINSYYTFNKTDNVNSGLNVKPEYNILWQNARSFYKGDSAIAEIPLKSLREEKSVLRSNDSTRFKNSFNKLLLMRIGDNTNAYLMNVIADDGIKISAKQFQDVFLLEKPSTFNGFVFYHNLEGKLLNGFRYSKGRPTQRLMPTSNKAKVSGSKTTIKDLRYVTYEVDVWTKSCVGVDDPQTQAIECIFNRSGTRTVGGYVNVPSSGNSGSGGGENGDSGDEYTPGGSGSGSSGITDDGPTLNKNETSNPCISAAVDTIITRGNPEIDLTNIIHYVFGANDHVNIVYKDGKLPNGALSKTVPVQDRVRNDIRDFTVTITLNEDSLPHYSQEFIFSLILHEIVHAHLTFNGLDPRDQVYQHVSLAGGYVTMIKQTLRGYFPNLSEREATSLALGGMNDYAKSPFYGSGWNEILNEYDTNTSEVVHDINLYKTTKGSRCP